MPNITFEGLDGAGKTTMAVAYARSVQGVYVGALSMHESWRARRIVVNEGKDVEARFNYFVDLNAAQMSTARKLAEQGISSTLDSSIYRTVATHRVLGSVAACQYEVEPELYPDMTFLLDVSESERTRRLHARDRSLLYSSDWDLQLHERQREVRAAFQDFGLISIFAEHPVAELERQVRAITKV